MSFSSPIKILILLVISFLLSANLWAEGPSCSGGGPAAQACCQKTKAAIQACEAAALRAKGQSNVAAGAISHNRQQNQDIHNSSLDLSGLTANTAAAFRSASQVCQGELAKCQCPPPPPKPPSEKIKVEQYQTQCKQSIEAKKAELDKSAAEAEKASRESGNTGQQSQGGKGDGEGGSGGGDSGGGSNPSPNKDKDKDKDKTKDPDEKKPDAKKEEEPPVPLGIANCSSDQAYLYASCTSSLVGECALPAQASQPRCVSFLARYCANSAGANSASLSPGASTPGAGASSDLCRSQVSAQFCKNSGNSACPSCKGLNPINISDPQQLAEVCGACASGSRIDPMFSDPSVASACRNARSSANRSGLSPQSASAGGAAGSGGGLAGGGAAGVGTVSSTGSGAGGEKSQSVNENPKLDVSTGGGGGGGGSSVSGGIYADGEEYSRSGSGGNPYGSLGAQSGSGPVITDVAVKAPGNVFAIASEVIKTKCSAKRLMHCGPR